MAVIIVTTVGVYLPSLAGGFLLDDNILLTDNPLIRAPDGLSRIWLTTEAIDYWPVYNTTFWVEWRVWGMQPTGYHVINLILHIAAALLLWGILRRIAVPGAFLGALLFAVHPVNVESVAWISQCKSVLAMLFFLISIACYLNSEAQSAPRPGRAARERRYYGLSVAAFVLAMLSKGSVAVLPALLLIILWWLRPLRRRDLARMAPFLAIAIVLVFVNIWFQTHGAHRTVRAAGMVERVLGAAAGVWFYLSKALLPIGLTFIYPQWLIDPNQLRWWVPLLAATAVTGVLWWYRGSWSRPCWAPGDSSVWRYCRCSASPTLPTWNTRWSPTTTNTWR